jgi:hypothetical protein
LREIDNDRTERDTGIVRRVGAFEDLAEDVGLTSQSWLPTTAPGTVTVAVAL